MAAMIAMIGLLAMVGLAIDGGRLMSNKSELQSVADSCALAAVTELANCSTKDITTCMTRASNKGVAMANGAVNGVAYNRVDLQQVGTALTTNDVLFSRKGASNAEYLTQAAYVAANTAGSGANAVYTPPLFVQCTAAKTAVPQIFAGFFKSMFNQDRPWGATAMSRATLATSSQFCSNVPMGACASYTKLNTLQKGSLIYADWQDNGSGNNGRTSLDGQNDIQMTWLAPAGSSGVPSIEAAMTQAGTTCYSPGQSFVTSGVKQGIKDAYNTRFGIYKNGSGYSVANAPPDRSGWVPPAKPQPGAYTSQVATYLNTVNSTTPADHVYNPPNNVYKTTGAVATGAQYIASGVQRRLISIPVFDDDDDCTSASTRTLVASGQRAICMLMLTPMENGSGGGKRMFFEYLGDATLPGSPCYGGPGTIGDTSGGGFGNAVPALVQ